MNAAKIFPIILIALDVGAAIVYACCGDWKHMTYWLAAATLTATVTILTLGDFHVYTRTHCNRGRRTELPLHLRSLRHVSVRRGCLPECTLQHERAHRSSVCAR